MIAQVPPAVMQIVQRVQAQERGIVMYHLRRVFDVHAGPYRRHDEMELAIVAQDGQTVRVRVVSASEGGKALDANQRAAIVNKYEHPAPGDNFDRPFDPKYVADYSFQSVDPKTYRFSSTIHDAAHASGTFWLDDQGNVARYQYTPYVLPQYTRSGTITDARAQVLPNFWYLTSESHQYSGRYAIFGAAATVVITYEGFKRFIDVPSAVAALNAGGS
jgi:hypothetical protein